MVDKLKNSEARSAGFEHLNENTLWDAVIVGAGAVGVGLAVDVAARGFKVLLLEEKSFGSDAHCRLLQSGPKCLKSPKDFSALRDFVLERKLLSANAPHLMKPTPVVVPCYADYKREVYMTSLLLQKAVSYGGNAIGRMQWLSATEVIRRLPDIKAKGLKGGVLYWDCCFDEAQLQCALVKTAERFGCIALDSVQVTPSQRSGSGTVETLTVKDLVSESAYTVRSRLIFNATGLQIDAFRAKINPQSRPMILPYTTQCLRADGSRFEGESQAVIPQTTDRQAMTILHAGESMTVEVSPKVLIPGRPQQAETGDALQKILAQTNAYLEFPLTNNDGLACSTRRYATLMPNAGGRRPIMVDPDAYRIVPEFGNLITIAGGSWALYRKIAEEAVNVAVDAGLIYKRPCPTMYMSIARC